MPYPLRKPVLASLAAALVCACASAPPVVDDLPHGRVQGDASHVSIEGGRWEALPLAVAHCARFGLSAQFERVDGDRAMFNCVHSGG